MKRYKKIGLHLCGLPQDDAVLNFATRLASLAETQQIYCVCAGDVEAEDTAAHDPRERIDALLRPNTSAEIDVQTTGGNGLKPLLALARQEELDMLFVGRTLASEDVAVGQVFTRIARKAPCTVFVVPAGARPHFARILVAIDFSDHAKLALEQALKFATTSGNYKPQVVAQSVYSVGYGYSKTGQTLEQARESTAKSTQKRLADLAAEFDTDHVTFEAVATYSKRPAQAVAELAAVRQMDLICIGSHGATSDAVALLGDTTERLLAVVAKPTLVVKEKGETAGFLDVLLGRL